jgi:hypothetical protein
VIGRAQARPRDLTPDHLQLMPEQQDLHLLPLLRATEQQQRLKRRRSTQ